MRSGIGNDARDPVFTRSVDANGNDVGAGGGAVTIADGADVSQGATTDAAYTDTTGAAAGRVVGLLKGLYAAFRTAGSALVSVASQSTATENLGLSSFARATIAGGGGANLGVLNYGYNPATLQQVWIRADNVGAYAVNVASGAAAAALTPVTNAGATSLVVKASAGNFFGGSIVAGATAGFLIAYNATAAPAANGALTANLILGAVQVAASGTAALGDYVVPDRASAGIVLLFSTSLSTFSAPANPAQFLRGRAL